MKYIVHTRFKGTAICGDVNLPAMTTCKCNGSFIQYNGKDLCYLDSENSHNYFAIDEDDMGMQRGKLTKAIKKTLGKRDEEYQTRWDKVWADEICQLYKRKDYVDEFLWNHDFYNADIEDLNHIANLVGAKVD
jgi:hypothetical protein